MFSEWLDVRGSSSMLDRCGRDGAAESVRPSDKQLWWSMLLLLTTSCSSFQHIIAAVLVWDPVELLGTNCTQHSALVISLIHKKTLFRWAQVKHKSLGGCCKCLFPDKCSNKWNTVLNHGSCLQHVSAQLGKGFEIHSPLHLWPCLLLGCQL